MKFCSMLRLGAMHFLSIAPKQVEPIALLELEVRGVNAAII
jgi:hypothetical protein